jgi:hypothetical protein
MYIIEANDDNWKWISGIFKGIRDLEQYFIKIPEELKSNQVRKRLNILEYPFYIIEKQEGFTYLNKSEFIQELNNIIYNVENEEVGYFNFYYIESDYEPKKPGLDYMGILTHDHVTNDFLLSYKKDGEDYLRRNRFC